MHTGKKIAFQGTYGAYSDLSCRTAYPDYETVACHSFDSAFAAVNDGDADFAMIPVDNTIAGRVADVHHLMPNGELFIIGEHFQPIEHCLLGIKGASKEKLKHVHSHIHALPQCKKMITRLNLEKHVHTNTAVAAKNIAERNNPEHAAIASSLAAEIYGLDILEHAVQDEKHNTTRFLVLAPEPEVPQYEENKKYITSLLFEARNIPAVLYKSLGGFATNGISMTKLESYVGENFQVAHFYCDVEGHPENDAFKLALEELGFYSEVTFLGTYEAHPFRSSV